mmetsp:Transcript_24146/g.59548  ORF Transcript_24146/g.59548 Transcript_24146/m.59548 type:complete len:271 (-) Transcript_24146:460-1272(-)|eukprot:CAMPEP_0206236962 /NCGR_PEP_ID=MMETSP0047_2-20121206/13996_1 /ASSEMBLY_ACC=CAM_ASM_000192 /TAXON_ID=195065 /ORGANISM="Chroomonas mesostigmatica_cf, Strain CCMP1168" /LENGTH=270 /DNA_ID=CAMNT_0053661335 /DNA_START=72 /DNA_END=884 /DNA_ORIENTATION=+
MCGGPDTAAMAAARPQEWMWDALGKDGAMGEGVDCDDDTDMEDSSSQDSAAQSQPWTGDEYVDSIMCRMFGLLEQGFGDGSGGIAIDSLQTPGSVKVVKGQGFIKATPQEVLRMIWDASKRPMWDDMCDFGSIVKSFSANSDVIYLSYQGKLGVCARDLCLLRAWREYDDGTCVLVSHSIDDEDVPKVAGKVRAELRDCAYVVKPREGGCVLSYVIQLDMKGYVPLFFTNLINTQHPLIISAMRNLLESGVQGGDMTGIDASVPQDAHVD